MIILVTGSSGFIGYHLSKYLLKKNFNIIGIDNHNKYYSNEIKKKRLSHLKKYKNFSFKKLNLLNRKKLEKIFIDYKPKVVFHLAGQPGVLYSFNNPLSYKLNNTLATKVICEIGKKYNIKKFIFGSSSSVYGDQKKFPIKESYPLKPKNPYAITKLKSERIVSRIFKKSKVDYIIFRFFTVYGPFGRPDMFIHKFLNTIKKNKKINLHNKGLNYRDFTYVDDVIKILYQSLRKKINNKTLNICRSKPIITLDLVQLILKIYGVKKAKIKKTNFVKGEMLKTHGSNNNLKKYFGKIKFKELKKGIKETIKIFKLYRM